MVEAISKFFGTREVQLSLDRHATGATRKYNHLDDVVSDVEQARVLAGFHFHNSDSAASTLGRKVARFVLGRFFRPRD